MVKASICTIGDEILIGQIVDTNSSHIAQALGEIGVRSYRMLSIGDEREEIIDNLSAELRKSDIVIVTGGLGPTKDDITKDALAQLSGARGYKENAEQSEIIYRILSARGLEVLDINKAQAYVPDTADVIPNRIGTAPIMVFRFPADGGFGHACTLYSLPGVPFEALGALPEVLADIRAHHQLDEIYHRAIMTYGLAESALSKKIEAWEDALPANMHLAYLPNPLTGVRLRLSVYGVHPESQTSHPLNSKRVILNSKRVILNSIQDLIGAELAKLHEIIGEYIYADHDSTLQEAIGELLRAQGKTVSAAESCTGGLISSLLTSVPGASEYYLGSVTSYANEVKTEVLGVPAEIIEQHGAVSSECVCAMAEGVRRLTGSDYSVATSGIAGPGGGSEEKPVGLVWIGVSSERGTKSFSMQFRNDRKRNIERFASSALDILRREITKDLNN